MNESFLNKNIIIKVWQAWGVSIMVLKPIISKIPENLRVVSNDVYWPKKRNRTEKVCPSGKRCDQSSRRKSGTAKRACLWNSTFTLIIMILCLKRKASQLYKLILYSRRVASKLTPYYFLIIFLYIYCKEWKGILKENILMILKEVLCECGVKKSN